MPADVDLLPGERVLWVGRPRPRDPLDGAAILGVCRTIAWLCVPAAALVARFVGFGWGPVDVPWIVVVGAGFWLAIGLWHLLVSPHTLAGRRARTAYVLTDVRAITITRVRRRLHLDSRFLDLATGVSLVERPDGYGDVGTQQGSNFERVPDARGVHTLLADAVRHAGGNPTRTTASPEDLAGDGGHDAMPS